MNNPTYLDIGRLLESLNADFNVAEAHGLAAGILCLDERTDWHVWLAILFQEQPLPIDNVQKMLQMLFEKTRRDLQSINFEFDLLLPSDEALLSERVAALSDWCSSFLLGIGISTTQATWPGNSGEILKDLIEFTKLDSEVHSEEDEQAFIELHEYCRAAVMLLKSELYGNQTQIH